MTGSPILRKLDGEKTMKRQRTGMAALAIVLALLLTLSACASGKPAPSATDAAAPAQTQKGETSGTQEPADVQMPSVDTFGNTLLGSLVISPEDEQEQPGEDDPAEELDLSAMESYMAMRGGMKWTIEEVEPEELDEEGSAAMDRAMRAYVPTTDAVIINEAKHFYVYDRLTPEEQDFYDAMYLVAIDPTTKDNIVSLRTSKDPRGREFGWTFASAQMALSYDHPELWWISPFNGQYDIDAYFSREENGDYDIRLQMNDPYVGFEKDVAAFNTAVGDVISGIDTSRSEMEIAQEVHDRLIEMAVYDYDVMNKNTDDLAHTAYGVFVSNSAGTPHHCVCDGYSLAYTYILQQLGFEATLVTGMAGQSGQLGGHAWSIVRIEDRWYEVDSTWDDYTELADQVSAEYAADSLEYRIFMEMIDDADYMNKLEHYLYAVETAQIQNYKPDSELVYHTKDGKYKITMVSESERQRFCDYPETKDSFQGYLTTLLPIADGTLLPPDTSDTPDTPDTPDNDPSKEEVPDEGDNIWGTYYVTGINGNPESVLIEAWGADYYKELDMFELRKDGTGTLYEEGREMPFVYTLTDGKLTMTFEGGYVTMDHDGKYITFVAGTGDVLTFDKLK